MKRLLGLVLILLFHFAVPTKAATEEELRQLQARLETVFNMKADWTDIKISLDEMAFPAQDEAGVRIALRKMRDDLQSFVAQSGARNAHEKLKYLKAFMYEAGPWNGNRPFIYDMDDPLGKITRHKTLEYYLISRKGNCVSMTLLFTMMGQSIGLDMTVATAPAHLFVKFTDEAGKTWNIETTSGGGYTRIQHYRREMPMSDLAIANGIYLRRLDEKQAVAAMAEIVISQLRKEQRWDEVLAASETILKHDPTQITALISRGSAFGRIMEQQFLQPFGSFDAMPPEIRQTALTYLRLNHEDFARAESLGWTERDGIKDQWPPYQAKPGEE
jgi:regulator of sirC expression with transglutaminase-like and TPR domain